VQTVAMSVYKACVIVDVNMPLWCNKCNNYIICACVNYFLYFCAKEKNWILQ